MISMLRVLVVLFVSSLLLVGSTAACGEPDRPGEGSTPATIVTGNTVISELDEAGVVQLCDDINDNTVAATSAEASCSFAMLDVGDMQSDAAQYCSDNWSSCLNQQGDFADEELDGIVLNVMDCYNSDVIDSRCDATVSEMRACFDERNAGANQLGRSFECSYLDSDVVPSALEEAIDMIIGNGPVCRAFYDSCYPERQDGGL